MYKGGGLTFAVTGSSRVVLSLLVGIARINLNEILYFEVQHGIFKPVPSRAKPGAVYFGQRPEMRKVLLSSARASIALYSSGQNQAKNRTGFIVEPKLT